MCTTVLLKGSYNFYLKCFWWKFYYFQVRVKITPSVWWPTWKTGKKKTLSVISVALEILAVSLNVHLKCLEQSF